VGGCRGGSLMDLSAIGGQQHCPGGQCERINRDLPSGSPPDHAAIRRTLSWALIQCACYSFPYPVCGNSRAEGPNDCWRCDPMLGGGGLLVVIWQA